MFHSGRDVDEGGSRDCVCVRAGEYGKGLYLALNFSAKELL
jgi:hypothetical protein